MLTSLLRSLFRTENPPKRRDQPVLKGPSDPNAPFAQRLAELLAQKIQVIEEDNFDHDRFSGEPDPSVRRAKHCEATMQDLLHNAPAYGAVHELLADPESRDWFTQLVAYRLLGFQHVRLPSNRPEHWETRDRVKAMSNKPITGVCGELSDYAVDFAGERIKLQAWWSNIAWTFFFRQYSFHRGTVAVAPQPGDYVIDAGACFGDTALGFAAAVGPTGRVASYEIDPKNAAVARSNLERNPALKQRISLRECALAHADIPLYLHGAGAAARVGSDPSGHRLEVTTIDRSVESGGLERLDFIKMDIEGAESYALRGAEQSLRRFRPRLAISVYHAPGDLWSIAQWIDSLGLGYRFHLDHYTIHYEETVLFADADL